MSLIPRKIRIGPTTVKVRIKKLEGLFAQYHYEPNEIDVHKGLSEGERRAGLLHELLHAVLHIYGISTVVGLSQQQEEKLILALEAPLLALLRDNPKVMEYLLAKEK
jgi:Zn-dependent peptidase ImmA (M78 family)